MSASKPGPPSADEVAEHILRALNDAGGRMKRAEIRNVVPSNVSATAFSNALADLKRRGLIAGERVMSEWSNAKGWTGHVFTTVYRLGAPAAGARTVSVGPPPGRNPVPTADELPGRIIEALRAAGGEMSKHELRIAVHYRIKTPDFDAAIDDLRRRRRIVVKEATYTRTDILGRTSTYKATVYRLARNRKTAP